MKPFNTLIMQVGAALLFGSSAVQAAEEITARFRPDPANPMSNKFENTTPISSICGVHIPNQCRSLNIFSLRDNDFAALSNGPIRANHEDERQGFMVKVPSDWRPLQVTHAGTGETETVELRIAGIGSTWYVNYPPGVSGWAQPGMQWSTAWVSPPSPCQRTGHLKATNSAATWFWLTPEGAGACSRKPSQEFAFMRIATMEYAYELRTPNPLTMSGGQYTGGITYTMGPGGDYDFGDVIIPSKNAITFNFTLSVEHDLKVDIPPGGNRVELLPEGGWQAWLNRGRVPARLYRDQTFRMAASSRFKMKMECSIPMGNTCGLRNPNGDEVPVQVAVTLPSGIDGRGNEAVIKRPLRLDGQGSELFQP
ncbi:hypothetical protein AO262_32660, partial [Pseudomonas fluorescens ABAC62]